jgi:SNF2 family DNA or RNA helicase
MLPVHVSPKHRVVGVPHSQEVGGFFPDAKTIDVAGHPHLVVPHDTAVTFILRRLGFDVPAPILVQYDWCGGKPFMVQRKTCALLSTSPHAYCLNDMGTGKTKAALWAWDYLRGNGHAGKLLIVAPLSTLRFVWASEVLGTIPHRKAVVLHHTDRAKRVARLTNSDAEIFIINPAGAKLIFNELMHAYDIDTLVIDELATYRNAGSDQSKVMQKLAARMRWVWGMTGAPIPTSPTDVFGQCKIVTPASVPRYFGRFRDALMYKPYEKSFRWLPKPDAIDRAFAAMKPAVRFALDDVVELPDMIERFVDVELGAKQAKVYKELAAHCYAAVQNKEITAANAGAVMMKLLQVACGWVYTREGDVVPLDNDKRITALMDGIMSTSRKVLVFVPFKHALTGISDALTHEGVEHANVSGDTPEGKRAEIFNAFQNTTKYRVINAHPQCLAHGITLTAADTVIWFAPIANLEIYDQANRRIRRVGQGHKQQLIHLQGTAVEKRIYSLLQKNQKVQDQLLGMFEDATVNMEA